MYKKAARLAAVTGTAAAVSFGGVALAPSASASEGYDHAPSWCAEWYIADGSFHCSEKFPAGQTYDYYANHGYRGEQYVRQFHAKNGGGASVSASTSTSKSSIQATGKVKYWYQDPNGHWWWTSHKDRYDRRLGQGWKGNGTNGPGSSSSPAAKSSSKPKVRKQSSSGASVYGGVWDRIAACESGGNWSINNGNGYYGGLQFTIQSWHAVGGSGLPSNASKAEQINRAQKLQAIQGWGAWPVCSAKAGLR